jgi:hypothetical protein
VIRARELSTDPEVKGKSDRSIMDDALLLFCPVRAVEGFQIPRYEREGSLDFIPAFWEVWRGNVGVGVVTVRRRRVWVIVRGGNAMRGDDDRIGRHDSHFCVMLILIFVFRFPDVT